MNGWLIAIYDNTSIKTDYSYCSNYNNNIILLQSLQYFERVIVIEVVCR